MRELLPLSVNVARVLIGLTFVFSGFVKAVDPIGFQYKLQDYMAAITDAYNSGFVHDWGTLVAAVLLSAFEFMMGVILLFAINRRIVSKIATLFMAVMTLVTVWVFVEDPVSDCGCFGEAVTLSNGMTLLKNIVLLALCVLVAKEPLRMPRLISLRNAWIVSNYSLLFILSVSVYALFDLPLLDFRPYRMGADIRAGMEIPEGAPQPQFNTVLTYEKAGERKTFTVDALPDSTWTFVDSKTTQTSKGYEPPIHDFCLMYKGEDITEDILSDDNYCFLLIAPHLETADDTQFGNINMIADYAERMGYRYLCLTASGEKAQENWADMTGAEYEFANCDETTLKTIVRSSPGLLLLKGGVVYQKWSHNILPELNEKSPVLEKTPYGNIAKEENSSTVASVLGWYLIPLLMLTVLDRLVFAIVSVVKKQRQKRKKTDINQQKIS